MPSYLINSFRGGISDYEDKGIPGSFKFASGLNIRRVRDTLYPGRVLKNFTMTGDTITNSINWIVSTTIDNECFYVFTTDGKIYEINSPDQSCTLVHTSESEKISGAALWYDSAGKKYLYWATMTKLHRKELPGNGHKPWDDVDTGDTFPATLTSSYYHTMKVVAGSLLICNGDKIASVDYDNVFTNEALRLIPGSEAKTLLDRNGDVIIAANTNDTYSELYLWDTLSDTYNLKKQIPEQEIQAMIDGEYPLMIAGAGKIYLSDLNNITPIGQLPWDCNGFNREVDSTGACYLEPGAIENVNGLVYMGVGDFSVANPGLYSYGRKYKNHLPVLNFDCLAANTVKEITCVKQIADIGVMMGCIEYSGSYSYTLKYVPEDDDPIDGLNTAHYYGLGLKSPYGYSTTQPLWKHVVVRHTPLPSGSKIELYYQLNKAYINNTAAIKARIDESFDYQGVANTTESVFLTGEAAKYFDYELVVTPDPSTGKAPEVYEIEIVFE